jgi:hypothetical protein
MLMKKQLSMSLAMLLLLIAVGQAQDPTTQPVLLDVSQSRAAFDDAMGKDVVVQGVVSSAQWSASGKVMNIEFRNAERSRFLAVVFERIRARIDEGFNGDAAKSFTGAKVRIHGTLEPYGGAVESMKGRPQIIIASGDDVTILQLATTQQAKP